MMPFADSSSYDIYIEHDGQRVAVVQSYTMRPIKELRYLIEMNKICVTDEAIRNDLNINNFAGFSFVVCKPDRNIIYTDCKWVYSDESMPLCSISIEKATAIAEKRIEVSR